MMKNVDLIFSTFREGLKVQVGNDSVNFKNSQSSPFLSYYRINTTEEGFLRIFDTAQISPLTVLLFAPMLPKIVGLVSYYCRRFSFVIILSYYYFSFLQTYQTNLNFYTRSLIYTSLQKRSTYFLNMISH